MDGNQRHSPITIQTRVKLVEQINLEPPCHKTSLHKVRDLKVEIHFLKIHLSVLIQADCT